MPPKKGNQNKRYKVSPLVTVAPRTRRQLAIVNCKIFTLNDDCLLEIYSYLSVLDLCAVKDSCRRFNVLANLCVQNRWKGKAFDCRYPGDLCLSERRSAIIRQHFGNCVEHAMIMKQESIYLVKKCGAKKMWIQLKHYTALRKLTIFNANVNRLPICHVKNTLQILTSLSLEGCVGNESEFARIINSCKNLLYLRLNGRVSISLLASICHELSNLEIIDFGHQYDEIQTAVTYSDSLAKLQNLRKLKSLTLCCCGSAVASAIAPLAKKESMECVILFRARSDKQLIRAFRKWAHVEAVDSWMDLTKYEFHRHWPTYPIIQLS